MRSKWTQSAGLGVSAAAVAATLAWLPPAYSHEVHYSGRATGFNGTLNAAGAKKTLVLADVAMACTGTAREETVSTVSNPQPFGIAAKTVTAYTLGRNDEAIANAGAEELHIDLGGGSFTLDATALRSHAQVNCDEATFVISKSGGSEFGSLTINGERFEYSGEPNETYEIPGVATVIINEQLNPNSRERIVNALHIKVADPSFPLSGDIVVAHSRAKLTCSR